MLKKLKFLYIGHYSREGDLLDRLDQLFKGLFFKKWDFPLFIFLPWCSHYYENSKVNVPELFHQNSATIFIAKLTKSLNIAIFAGTVILIRNCCLLFYRPHELYSHFFKKVFLFLIIYITYRDTNSFVPQSDFQSWEILKGPILVNGFTECLTDLLSSTGTFQMFETLQSE